MRSLLVALCLLFGAHSFAVADEQLRGPGAAIAAASVGARGGSDSASKVTTPGSGHAAFVSASDFGARNGSDCTAAIQAAVDYLVANNGGKLGLPSGYCFVSRPILISKGIVIEGAGIGVGIGAENAGGTVLRASSAAGDVITIASGESVILRDFTIDSPAIKKAAGTAGVRIQGERGAGSVNSRSRLENLRIFNMYDAIVTDAAVNLVIRGCHLQDYLHNGVYYKQTGATDYGHTTIDTCVIWDMNVGTSHAGIEYAKGGDIRISNNKFLGSQVGFGVDLTDGETGTFLVTSNSFEEQTENNIRFRQSVPGKNLGNVVIVGNQFSTVAPPTPRSNILIDAGVPGAGASSWIKNGTISGNVVNNAHNAAYPSISIQDGDGMIVAANTINHNGKDKPIGIDVGGRVRTAKVVGNLVINTPRLKYTPSTYAYMVPSAILSFSSGATPISSGSTAYLGTADAGGEAISTLYLPFKAALLNLTTSASTGPGLGESFAYTLRIAGNDSALTTQTHGLQSDSQDRKHVVLVPSPAGPNLAARLSFQVITSAKAVSATHRATIEIVQDD